MTNKEPSHHVNPKGSPTALTVSQLFTYPIKSCQGIQLSEATFGPRGILYDRMWLVIDDRGIFQTQRKTPRLASIETAIENDELVVRSPLAGERRLPLNGYPGPLREGIRVHDSVVAGIDQGEEIATWLNRALVGSERKEFRLLRFYEAFDRVVDPFFTARTDVTTCFADGFPYLVTNEASLGDLNERLTSRSASAVPIYRFRPNVVVTGLAPWEEDTLAGIRFPDSGLELTFVKPCSRCEVITTDQLTGERISPEPLSTLATFRIQTTRAGRRGVMFGQNAILTQGSSTPVECRARIERLVPHQA